MLRKLAKLKRDPVGFFADSRGVGERLVTLQKLQRLNRGLDAHPALVLGVPQALRPSVALCFPKLALRFISSNLSENTIWPKNLLILCWFEVDQSQAIQVAMEHRLPMFLIEVDVDGDLALVEATQDVKEARYLRLARDAGKAAFQLLSVRK